MLRFWLCERFKNVHWVPSTRIMLHKDTLQTQQVAYTRKQRFTYEINLVTSDELIGNVFGNQTTLCC